MKETIKSFVEKKSEESVENLVEDLENLILSQNQSYSKERQKKIAIIKGLIIGTVEVSVELFNDAVKCLTNDCSKDKEKELIKEINDYIKNAK